MIDVVGIKFSNNDKIYYFSPNGLNLKISDCVIVETEKGLQFAKVYEDIKKMPKKNLFLPLKEIIRIATKKDIETFKKNNLDAKKALSYAREIVLNDGVDMKIFEASYTFDRKKLIYKFIADERVDFRDLAKKLASKFKTRIELRQIGTRDKAKEVGGLGPCGRLLCCNEFLNSFDSISINMAKNQGIALNPSKINGSCGRLLCCLGYEDETYMTNKKNLPKIGEIINKNGKKGKVIDLNILKMSYKIITDDNEQIEFMVDNDESHK